MKLWGVVIEVNQKDIVVSLPGGMRGFVRSEDVCDTALQAPRKVGDIQIFFCSSTKFIALSASCHLLKPSDIFLLQDCEHSICAEVVHVGQLVPCIVLRVDNDKKEGKGNWRIWLSLRLSLLYKGLSLDALQEGMVISVSLYS
jgi:rRNA biogenesis protein RRP5